MKSVLSLKGLKKSYGSRKALSGIEARTELLKGAGSQFDPDCVEAMIRALDRRDSAATVVALRPPSS